MNTPKQLIAGACVFLAIGSAQSMLAQAPPPAPVTNWVGTVALGLTLTKGNSDTLLFNALALAEKKWDRNELSFGADATYGEQDDVKNNESVHGFGQYNRLFTDRFFGYLRADALHDGIADVDYRVTLSPGVGYYFVKNERTFLRGEVGPGVIFEKQGGVSDTYFTVRVAERFEHKLSKTAKVWQSVEFLPDVGDWENYIVNFEIGVEVAINTKWSVRVFFQDTYDNEPAQGRERNDLKLVSGIAYKF